jgi:hypothetical protein
MMAMVTLSALLVVGASSAVQFMLDCVDLLMSTSIRAEEHMVVRVMPDPTAMCDSRRNIVQWSFRPGQDWT